MGVNDAGLVLASLNAAPSGARCDAGGPDCPPSFARLCRAGDAPDRSADLIVEALGGFDPTLFNPYRLVIVHAPTVTVVSSDGDRLTTSQAPLAHPMLFTSSSLGDALVERPRRDLFERMVVRASGQILDAQARFHRHQWRARPEISVHMQRADALTVSRTLIDVTRRGWPVYEPLTPAAKWQRRRTWCFALMLGTLVSEDVACVTAGLLIREGHISAATGVLSCALGIVLGDIGLWALGRTGRRITRLKDMARWLEKGAAVAIVASRFLPGTRLPLYVAAGAIGVAVPHVRVVDDHRAAIRTPMLVLFSASIGEVMIAVAALTLVAGSRQQTASRPPARRANTARARPAVAALGILADVALLPAGRGLDTSLVGAVSLASPRSRRRTPVFRTAARWVSRVCICPSCLRTSSFPRR